MIDKSAPKGTGTPIGTNQEQERSSPVEIKIEEPKPEETKSGEPKPVASQPEASNEEEN